MLKLQAFAKVVKSAAVTAREKFLRIKTVREDFNYLPMTSRMAVVPEVKKERITIGNLPVDRYT
jgi:hypothetical protein